MPAFARTAFASRAFSVPASVGGALWSQLSPQPTSTTDVTVAAGTVLTLDVASASARTLTVLGTFINRSGAAVQLTLYGNLVNRGVVDFDAARSAWFFQFIVPTETQFVGGGMVPLASDIGWWNVDSGRVNLQGNVKTPWTRLTGGVVAGTTSITVQNATGWRVGDEIAIVPSEPPRAEDVWTHYDVRMIIAMSGTTLTLNAALTYAHPAVTFPVFTNGILTPTTFTAEVLNLTRTGRIEGRPGLRIHFFMHNSVAVAQTLSYIQFRYLGPRQTAPGGVVGRWGGPHFHMNGDLSNGSLVEGTVARDFGSHAYIPHDSNGITFRSNIAHDGIDQAWWWDGPPDGPMGSNHLLIDNNVASRVLFAGDPQAPAVGFQLKHGVRMRNSGWGFEFPENCSNIMTHNVAVGIEGTGFGWPEVDPGQWQFETNLSHNNNRHGFDMWINDVTTTIGNFVAYHNQRSGIDHGAYGNTVLFRDVSLYGNSESNIRLAAFSQNGDGGLRFLRIYADGASITQNGMNIGSPIDFPSTPTQIIDSQFQGHTVAVFTDGGDDDRHPQLISVRNVVTVGNRYWIPPTTATGTLFIDYDLHLNVHRFDQAGTFVPAWNARTTPL